MKDVLIIGLIPSSVWLIGLNFQFHDSTLHL